MSIKFYYISNNSFMNMYIILFSNRSVINMYSLLCESIHLIRKSVDVLIKSYLFKNYYIL